jgi:hypothetical protein
LPAARVTSVVMLAETAGSFYGIADSPASFGGTERIRSVSR